MKRIILTLLMVCICVVFCVSCDGEDTYNYHTDDFDTIQNSEEKDNSIAETSTVNSDSTDKNLDTSKTEETVSSNNNWTKYY